MNRVGCGIVACLCLAALAFAGDETSPASKTSENPTTAASRQSPLELSISMPTTRIVAGQPVWFDLTLKNCGDQAVDVVLGHSAKIEFKMYVDDINANPVSWTRYGDMMQNPRRRYLDREIRLHLVPDQVLHWKFQLEVFLDLTMPDTYWFYVRAEDVRLNGQQVVLTSNAIDFVIGEYPYVSEHD